MSPHHKALARATAAAVFTLASITRAADTTSQKPAPPTGERLAAATAAVTEAEGIKQLLAAAKTPQQKTQLAQDLLAAAPAEKADTQYATLELAKDLAIAAGDADTLAAAIDAIDHAFQVDALKLHADAAPALCKNIRARTQTRLLLDWASRILDDAVNADRYDVARTMGDACLLAARGLGDPALQKETAVAVQRARELEQAHAALKKTIELLAQRPDDPDANLKVGKFYCFYKGDWTAGLPLLAKSNDQQLAPLAQAELAAPSSADDQVKLADKWIDVSRTLSGGTKTQVQQHAANLYSDALPRLEDPLKSKVEARIDELGGATSKLLFARPEGKDLGAKIMSRLPKQLQPAAGDTPDDLKAKNNALKQWVIKNPIVDIRAGTDATIHSKFMSVNTASRLQAQFEERDTYRDMPCRVTIAITRQLDGPDKPAPADLKLLENATPGQLFAVTAKFNFISIFYQPGKNAEAASISIKINSDHAPFTLKPARPR